MFFFFCETDALCSDGFLSQRHLKTNQLTIVNSMEQYTCGDCNATKDLDKFTHRNTTCNASLEKGRRCRATNPD